MLTFLAAGGEQSTMRYSRLFVGFFTIASVVGAQTQDSQSATPANPPAQSEPKAATPANSRPPVDGAKVTGSTFHSDFLNLTYELPKDWKAMDDAARMAANQQMREEDLTRTRSVAPATRKKSGAAKPAAPRNPAIANIKPTPLETYSLMVASPTGVDSLASNVLPRINIWAHKRVAPLDSLDDHAQFLVAMKRSQVLIAPQKVTIDGHEFVRADVITPSGVYRAQFVTAVNDYLVGFEFQALSKKEADAIVDTTKSIKFR
jgi:hypothetical protein